MSKNVAVIKDEKPLKWAPNVRVTCLWAVSLGNIRNWLKDDWEVQ